MDLPTIAIADATAPGGFRLINEIDFDPDEHKRYSGKTELPEQSVPPAPTAKPSKPLGEMTLTQLQALAQAENIRGRSSMTQEKLIEALEKKGYERGSGE